jgi:predicted acylesterase/phospholipase RssA
MASHLLGPQLRPLSVHLPRVCLEVVGETREANLFAQRCHFNFGEHCASEGRRAGMPAQWSLVPLGYVHGQKFDLELNRLTQRVVNIRDFDQLPIPFRAIAADLESGKEVVLRSGNLSRSIPLRSPCP